MLLKFGKLLVDAKILERFLLINLPMVNYPNMQLMDARDFVKDLDSKEIPFYKACEVLITDFFYSDVPKGQLIRTIKQRCYNEFMAAETFADELTRFGYELDRGLYILIARQVEDEATHYDLLAKVIEDLTNEPLNPRDLSPTQVQKQLGYAGNDVLSHMAFRFCAEGRSAFLASLMIKVSEKLKLGAMASAYRVIERDEVFHKKIADIGLEMFAKTQSDQNRVRNEIAIARERAFRNFYDIYGPNEKAKTIYENAYGKLASS
jgi:hypothetical protein